MLTRFKSGCVYIAILVAAFLLKVYVNSYFYDILVWGYALIGTYEMARACALPKIQMWIVMAFALLWVPVCLVSDYLASRGQLAFIIFFCIEMLFVFTSLIMNYHEVSVESTAKAMFCVVYPSLFLAFMLETNHLPNSQLAVLMTLVISPCADVFAYLFGYFLHNKFPKKMAPSISPNKTWIGAIGGLVGGMVASVVLCLLWFEIKSFGFELWKMIIAFAVAGILCAAATEIGDLTESAIKRKLGIKDMGNIMPGHGGILDRIDGTMFVSLVVYIAAALIPLFTY